MFTLHPNSDGSAHDHCNLVDFTFFLYNKLIYRKFQVFRFDWAHLFSFKSIFHWPWTPDADRIIRNGRSLEMLAVGLIVYSVCYAIQRIFNFLFYERYIMNSVQQFIDICSMSNISMFIFVVDSYGYYIHGRY